MYMQDTLSMCITVKVEPPDVPYMPINGYPWIHLVWVDLVHLQFSVTILYSVSSSETRQKQFILVLRKKYEWWFRSFRDKILNFNSDLGYFEYIEILLIVAIFRGAFDMKLFDDSIDDP